MNGTRRVAGLAVLALLCLTAGFAFNALAQPAEAQEGAGSKQPYTMAEYNSYKAAESEQDPAQRVKLLDDFVAKYPNSALLTYAYSLYYKTYYQLKNWNKAMDYVDKFVGLGDKVGPNDKYDALYVYAYAYNALNSQDPALAKAAMTACTEALKLTSELKKPEQVSDAAFEQSKKTVSIYQNGTCAKAAMVQKDYSDAITFYKAVLVLNPDEPVTTYSLGRAYLEMTPPDQMDGFWYIARAAASKSATEKQSTEIKNYLRKLIASYQGGTVCDSLTDAELNELLQLAASSADRPATYKLASAADLTAARTNMTIASVIAALKAGGDNAKTTWLASCGLEFPDVPGKLLQITPGATADDPIDLQVAFVTSDAEFQAATAPDMDVKIVGQPEAARLEKDNPVRFTATLSSYDPAPNFMLHWDKGKVNPDDIPKEKTPARRPARRPRKPGR
jgi:tetratricopeptide (TPR) repeat protein